MADYGAFFSGLMSSAKDEPSNFLTTLVLEDNNFMLLLLRKGNFP